MRKGGKPDLVFNAGDGPICLEIDSLQGDMYRMIVRLADDDGKVRRYPDMETFFRTGKPYKEKK